MDLFIYMFISMILLGDSPELMHEYKYLCNI